MDQLPLSKRTLGALFFVFLALAGFTAGYAIDVPSLDSASQPASPTANDSMTVQSAPIPDGVSDGDVDTSGIVATFDRSDRDHRILDRPAHDGMLFRTPDEQLYLIGTRGNGHSLYQGSVATPSTWSLRDGNYLATIVESAFDSIVFVEGRYVAYGNTRIYSATPSDVRTDNWTRHGLNEFNDLGAYYDGERVHVYYEVGDSATFSGTAIGHATSPDGITNWTVYPPVWTAPEGWGVGDFEVVVRNDTVILFGDYAQTHPAYVVGVWANDNPYTEFTQLPSPAIEPRSGTTEYEDDYGVQDPTIVHVEGDRYLMVANGHGVSDRGAALHYYTGTINVTADP